MGIQVPQLEVVDEIVHVPVQTRRQVPMVQDVQREIMVPQVEFIDRHTHVPVHTHRHVPMVQEVTREIHVPVIETVEKVVDVPVVKQVTVPQITTVEKVVEVKQKQCVEKVVDVPMVADTITGNQHHVHHQLPVQRQQHAPDVHHEFEHGAPFETHFAGAQPGMQPIVRSVGAIAQPMSSVAMGSVAQPIGTITQPMSSVAQVFGSAAMPVTTFMQ